MEFLLFFLCFLFGRLLGLEQSPDILIASPLLGHKLQRNNVLLHGREDYLSVVFQLIGRPPRCHAVLFHGREDYLSVASPLGGHLLQCQTVLCHRLDGALLFKL